MAKNKYYTLVEPKLGAVEDWARAGLSEKQIAKNLGVSESTLDNYKRKHAALTASLARGKEQSNAEVENALFKRSTGYTVEVEKNYKLRRSEYDSATGRKIADAEELVTRSEQVHIPADVNAQKFYLTNRAADRWRLAPETTTGDDDNDGGVVMLPSVVDE